MKTPVAIFLALALLIIGVVIGYTLKEQKPGKSEVRIDTVWNELPPVTKWKKGKATTDTLEVEDTAKTNFYRRAADSIAQERDVLARKLMTKYWYYEDSVQRSRHEYDPMSESYTDSIGYKPRKEKTIIKDSTTVREPTFWEQLQQYGIGFLIGYGAGKTL